MNLNLPVMFSEQNLLRKINTLRTCRGSQFTSGLNFFKPVYFFQISLHFLTTLKFNIKI